MDEYLTDEILKIEKLLEEYEQRIHLDKIKIVEPRMDITSETMLSMCYEDLQVLSWEYGQYSLAIQKELNRQIRRFNWTDANLKRLLERESENYSGFKWEERQSNVINNNIFAQKLHKLKIKTKLAIDTLSFLPSKIEFLAKLASDIMKTKRYHQDGN